MKSHEATDIQIYCDFMVEVRIGIGIVQSVLDGAITIGIDGCNTERIFLQLRKTMEVIAFASLSANRAKYSTVHANFAKHWKAKDLLGALEKVSSHFYPVPLEPPQTTPLGIKHFALVPDGFMTKAEFASLYDVCSEVLHKRNPYTEGDAVITIEYSVQKWVDRIQRLLGCHSVELANGDQWIVIIPNEGPVQVTLSSPVESSGQ
jgi:hypothetical protein